MVMYQVNLNIYDMERGTVTSADGSTSTGNLPIGKGRNGPNGEKYVGEFKDGNGPFILYWWRVITMRRRDLFYRPLVL